MNKIYYLIIFVSVCFFSCISTGKSREVTSFQDIENLSYTKSKESILTKIKSFHKRNSSSGDKKLSFRLSQYARIKYPNDERYILSILKSGFFIADVSNAKLSVSYAEHAIKDIKISDCNSPMVSYFYALNLGLILKEKGLLELSKLPVIHKSLLCAVKKPELDNAGPLRVLGFLYLKAPSWPQGIGDLDKALKYLKQAVETGSDFPENYIFYAEALIENENKDKALEMLKKAESLLDDEKWGSYYSLRWKKHIIRLQNK